MMRFALLALLLCAAPAWGEQSTPEQRLNPLELTSPTPSSFLFMASGVTIVRFDPDGTVYVNPDYTADEAARKFLGIVRKMAPETCSRAPTPKKPTPALDEPEWSCEWPDASIACCTLRRGDAVIGFSCVR